MKTFHAKSELREMSNFLASAWNLRLLEPYIAPRHTKKHLPKTVEKSCDISPNLPDEADKLFVVACWPPKKDTNRVIYGNVYMDYFGR